MKQLITYALVTLLSLNAFLVNSQSNQQCESKKTDLLDLNSISKCTIEKSKDEKGTEQVTLNVAAKKTRKRVIRKREKANSIDGTNNMKQTVSSSDEIIISNEIVPTNISTEEVLFNVVDEVPLFSKCENANGNKIDCFNNEFSKHFAKNFDPERASTEGVSGRVFLQFTIDTKGKINKLLVKSRTKNSLLEKEIKRVIGKLPQLSPGKHQGIPVNVTYSLPINFSTD